MPTYKFPEFTAQIQNPQISIFSYVDNMDGTCVVTMKLSLGAPHANSASFNPELHGYTYETEPTYADILAWALIELVNFEV